MLLAPSEKAGISLNLLQCTGQHPASSQGRTTLPKMSTVLRLRTPDRRGSRDRGHILGHLLLKGHCLEGLRQATTHSGLPPVPRSCPYHLRSLFFLPMALNGDEFEYPWMILGKNSTASPSAICYLCFSKFKLQQWILMHLPFPLLVCMGNFSPSELSLNQEAIMKPKVGLRWPSSMFLLSSIHTTFEQSFHYTIFLGRGDIYLSTWA